MVSSGLVDRVDVSHYRLSLHLVTAFIILSIVFWKFLKLTNLKNNQITIKLNSLKFFLLLIFLQLIIGAFVSGMDAGKVYNTWPLMGSTYFPNDSSFTEFQNLEVFDNPSIVQFVHRNLAYLIVFVYLYILYTASTISKLGFDTSSKANCIDSTVIFAFILSLDSSYIFIPFLLHINDISLLTFLGSKSAIMAVWFEFPVCATSSTTSRKTPSHTSVALFHNT